MPLRVGVIVEGHGEYESVRCLLERIWYELTDEYIDVIRPNRAPLGKLLQEAGLKKAVEEVYVKLNEESNDGFHKLVLILIDADDRCPASLAPQLLGWARSARSDADIACVIPNPMYETWFAAAAESLADYNGLPTNLTAPADPEGSRIGSSWIQQHLNRKYSKRIDQARFSSRIDLSACKANTRSFDKLYRELANRVPSPPDPAPQPTSPPTD